MYLRVAVPTLFLLHFSLILVSTMGRLDATLLSELEKIIGPLNISVVELVTAGGRGGLQIKVVIDKGGGVSLNDCERVTKLFNERLSILSPIDIEDYTLEVSSPGTQRVFKNKKEYNLFKGRRVKITLDKSVEQTGTAVIDGILEGMEDGNVALTIGGKTLSIPLDNIRKTKLNG